MNKRNKINILYLIWGTSYGGAERFVLNIIKNLDKKKFNIFVLSDDKEKGPLHDDFIDAGAKLFYSRYNAWLHPLKYGRQLKEIIDENNISVIHANNDQNMYFALKNAPKNIKFIAHAHNTNFRFTRIDFISNLVTRKLSKYITKNTSIRLSCGKDAGDATFLGKKYEIIPNGFNLDDFRYNKKERTKIREELGIGESDIALLNIGRMVKQKNQTFLIDMFSAYRKINRNSQLIIIGKGDLRHTIEQKIADYKIENFVKIINPVSNISNYYSASDLFVMTSLYEGLPYVAVEAQANSLKCVYSDRITKSADLFGDSTYIPLDKGPEYWAETIKNIDMSRRGKLTNKNLSIYDIKKVVERLSEIYNS